MRTAMLVGLIVAFTGCSRVSSSDSGSLDMTGVHAIAVEIEQGDFLYRGSNSTTLDWDVESVGRGGGKTGAEEHMDGNSWDVGVTRDTVTVFGQSSFVRADVNVDMFGNQFVDGVIRTPDGGTSLQSVDGVFDVIAEGISVTDTIGSGSFISHNGDVFIEMWPYEDAAIDVAVTGGDAVLALPYDLGYTITVFGDPNEGIGFVNLGFDDVRTTAGTFQAYRHPGNVRIQVHVNGGTFQLRGIY